MPADLEADIQAAWDKANRALRSTEKNKDHLIGLIAALRRCALRAKAIGFEIGETELLRVSHYLEGRIAPSEFPRYMTN
jgi:hypothetical protein